MNRKQLIAKVEKRWGELQASFADLSDEEICREQVFGEWSLKDILGHVTTWEAEMLTYLPGLIAGERTKRYSDMYGGVDAFNALKVAEKQALSQEQIRRQMEETHQRVISLLQSIPEAHIARENRVRKRIRYDTYGHYKEHTEAIHAAFGSHTG